MLVGRRVANILRQHIIDPFPVPQPAVKYIASYIGVHASRLGKRDGPHQWAGLSARPWRRLWTRAPESGFSPAGGREFFMAGLPTDACVFCAGAVCLHVPFFP